MSQIKWENVPESEVRAEVEAVLESQGEAKRIRQALSQNAALAQWREKVRDLCRQQIDQKGLENLTPDVLFDEISAQAREMIPEEVTEDIRQKLRTFLLTQFEGTYK